MKLLFKLLLVLASVTGLLWFCLVGALPVFLVDVMRIHGSAMAGEAVRIQLPMIDWKQRIAVFSGMALAGVGDSTGNEAVQLEVGRLDLHVTELFKPEWRAATLLPAVLELDLIKASGISLAYDIDSMGGNLHTLRQRLSGAANESLRDRLNTRKGSVAPRQLFAVRRLQLEDIVVRARSASKPEASRDFRVNAIELSDIGTRDQGVGAAEIADQISRRLVDEVQRQAVIQGVVDVRRDGESRAVRAGNSEDEADGGESPRAEDNKVKKAAKAVKGGFQDLGRGLKRGFREIVD